MNIFIETFRNINDDLRKIQTGIDQIINIIPWNSTHDYNSIMKIMMNIFSKDSKLNFVLYDWQIALKEIKRIIIKTRKEIKREIELKNIELEENKDHLNKNKIWKLNEELKELESNSEKDENINQK